MELRRAGMIVSIVLATVAPNDVAPAGAGELVDVARDVGLAQRARSWEALRVDLLGDDAPDLLLGRHQRPAQIWRNVGGTFEEVPIAFPAVDRHDCAAADVDGDGMTDLYCSLGAELGIGTKANELWIQGAGSTFEDRAGSYGVTDPVGRGRHVAFLDVNRDGWVDLFVGNTYPRHDDARSPNRLFLNARGAAFVEVAYGVRHEIGANCVEAVDVDADGWSDLLVCGRRRLYAYRNVAGNGFREVAHRWGIDLPRVRSVQLADLDRDGDLDLASIGTSVVRVQLQDDGSFGRRHRLRRLTAGFDLTAGDPDGDGDADLLAVQTCDGDSDRRDLLFRNRGEGTRFAVVRAPRPGEGCGDASATIDADGDGRDAFVVMNGNGRDVRGPVQYLVWNGSGA